MSDSGGGNKPRVVVVVVVVDEFVFDACNRMVAMTVVVGWL